MFENVIEIVRDKSKTIKEYGLLWKSYRLLKIDN